MSFPSSPTADAAAQFRKDADDDDVTTVLVAMFENIYYVLLFESDC